MGKEPTAKRHHVKKGHAKKVVEKKDEKIKD